VGLQPNMLGGDLLYAYGVKRSRESLSGGAGTNPTHGETGLTLMRVRLSYSMS